MHVRFFESGGRECVAIRTGFDGKDEVHRDATPEDRERHAAEYAAFRPSPVVEVPDVAEPLPPVVVPAKSFRKR